MCRCFVALVAMHNKHFISLGKTNKQNRHGSLLLICSQCATGVEWHLAQPTGTISLCEYFIANTQRGGKYLFCLVGSQFLFSLFLSSMVPCARWRPMVGTSDRGGNLVMKGVRRKEGDRAHVLSIWSRTSSPQSANPPSPPSRIFVAMVNGCRHYIQSVTVQMICSAALCCQSVKPSESICRFCLMTSLSPNSISLPDAHNCEKYWV